MNKPFFILLLFFAIATYAQQQERVAIINTVDDRDSIGFSELNHLTDRLREVAAHILPKQHYGIMSTESIVAFLGSQENAEKVCRESGCLADVGRKVNADYVAQAHIGRFGGNFTINTALYNSKSGNLIGSFTGNSVSLHGLRAVIDEEAPALFKKILVYVVNINSEPSGADLKFNGVTDPNCAQTPCTKEFIQDSVHITASLDQYKTEDITVSITQRNQNINIKLKRYIGELEIKPAYLDGIGKDRPWNLSINDKPYSLEERIMLYPNVFYKFGLDHECYEDVRFEKDVNEGGHEVYDLAGKIVLKKGDLTLIAYRTKLDGKSTEDQPVFVNGKERGRTPFNGSVPICSKIEIGENKETVYVDLKYNEKVEYAYKMKPSKAIFATAVALDLAGAGFIVAGILKNETVKSEYSKYNERGKTPDYYTDAREKVEKAQSQRNMFYIIGGALLATGIGVHIWF